MADCLFHNLIFGLGGTGERRELGIQGRERERKNERGELEKAHCVRKIGNFRFLVFAKCPDSFEIPGEFSSSGIIQEVVLKIWTGLTSKGIID